MSRTRYPTIEEWQTVAKASHPQWPERDSRSAWEHYESQGWKRGKSAIVKWRICIETCFQRWAGDPANASRAAQDAKTVIDPYKEPSFDWRRAVAVKWPRERYPGRDPWEEGAWSDFPLHRRKELLGIAT